MTATDCARTRALVLELVRGDDPPAEAAAHLAACPGCRAIEAGAARLRGDLDAWETPAPPGDLVERALARFALAGRAPGAGDGGDDGVSAAAAVARDSVAGAGRDGLAPIRRLPPRRRTSVELLTSAVGNAESAAASPPSRGRLAGRVLLQAAAAVVLFVGTGAFFAVFQPAVAHALEERRLHACGERLARLAEAAARYRAEWPEGEALSGHELRRALIDGGYADPADFVCAGPWGDELGRASFDGDLPAGPIGKRAPVFWEKFGNHPSGVSVAYADGRVELVTSASFGQWWRDRQPGSGGE